MALNFKQKCYKIIKKIPKGKVTTYKAVGNILNTKAYRAVGNAMKANILTIKIPCHRVINSNGSLRGYSKGINKKISLLKSEGIKIKNNKMI